MKAPFAYLIATLCLFGSSLSFASGSAKLLGSCDYYDSLSTELGCPADGYLQNFGAHYCRRFDQEVARFSEQGRQTLDSIRLCLQQSLELAPQLTCENVLDIAADSHVPCYGQAHFCEMNVWDKFALMEIVFPALLDSTLNRAIRKIESSCLRKDFARHQASKSPPSKFQTSANP